MPESEIETEPETAGSLHHLRKIDLEVPSLVESIQNSTLTQTLGKRPGNMAALSGDWIEKQPSSNQMHPRRRAVFPSLGSMARDQVTTLWTAYVFNP